MKVYVCALAKNEHLYINEWVGHYVKLGVDKIFIYDNDDKASPKIIDFIDEEYHSKVKVINARGMHLDQMQSKFYRSFYEVENRNFDWCLFCDIDEFLTGITDIKKFLSKPCFKQYEQIRVKWKLFGDDDLIERDLSVPVMQAFTKEITSPLTKDLSKPCGLNNQGKSIVRGKLKYAGFYSVHFMSRYNNIVKSCLPSGLPCYSGVEIKENYSHETVFLNHYMTKSLSEFVKQKLARTDAVFYNRILDMSYYWRLNTKTQEKLDYLKNIGLNN